MDISAENIKNGRYYGYEEQSGQLVEECAELIQAVSKFRRVGEDINKREVAFNNLVEEIADVEVMLEQIKVLLGIHPEDLTAVKQYKVNRTMERIRRTHTV